MALYIIIATAIIFGTFIEGRSHRYYKFIIVVLFIFTALHNPLVNGTDPKNYMRIFGQIQPISSFSHNSYLFSSYGIGIPLLMSISKEIINDYFCFQLLYCALSTFLLYRVLNKAVVCNKDRFLVLFVYFCFRYFQNSMEFLRQGIAIELLWMAFINKNDDHKFKIYDIFLVILASAFHSSALIGLVIIPIERFVINRINHPSKMLYITILLSMIMFIIPTSFYSEIVHQIGRIVGNSFDRYIEDIGHGERLNIINYIVRVLFMFIFSLNINGMYYKKKKTVFFLGCVAILIGSIRIAIFIRVLEYFMIALYIAIALGYKSFSRNSQKIYIIVLWILFTILLIRNLHTVSGGTYMNYQLYPF